MFDTTRRAFNSIEIPKISIVFWWHFVLIFFEFFNYAVFMRNRGSENDSGSTISSDLIRAHLAFCIIMVLAFAAICGPLLLISYKYAETDRDRSHKLKLAITVMYFLATKPLLIIELWAIKLDGMIHILQGVCFIMQLIAWFFASWIVWFFWMGLVSKWIFESNGYGRDVVLRRRREEMFRGGGPDLWQNTNSMVPVSNPLPGFGRGARDWAV